MVGSSLRGWRLVDPAAVDDVTDASVIGATCHIGGPGRVIVVMPLLRKDVA
jgi:hypothetical protein